MWFLYQTIIRIYQALILAASPFSLKAKKWLSGREHLLVRISDGMKDRPAESKLVWFHCASLGEFEQGRPVIEAFRKQFPEWKILLTFFSPSGYDIRKNFDQADWVYYLPLDTRRNSRKFLELTRPDLAVFVKYEFWFNYFDLLHAGKVPILVISAIFRPGQHFFRWYGRWPAKQLAKVTRFFVQDRESADLLAGIGIGQVTVSGDTRFDRVAAIADNAKKFEKIGAFAEGHPVLVAGSTWPADEDLLLTLIGDPGLGLNYIIAPHEVSPARLKELENRLSGTKWCLFSTADDETIRNSNVLIIDSIGFLSHLYQYADITYIGGGFGGGIHNILEAAVFGKPVLFGPNYSKFREARELVDRGGAFPMSSGEELWNIVSELSANLDKSKTAGAISGEYVNSAKGATTIILQGLQEMI